MNQREEVQRELISAYLDGELSPDEVAYFEHLVSSRKDYGQTLEELRALIGDLRELPPHRLDAQFSDRVVAAAQQAGMLAPADGHRLGLGLGRVDSVRHMRWRRAAMAMVTLSASALAALGIVHWKASSGSLDGTSVAQSQGLARENATPDRTQRSHAARQGDTDAASSAEIERASTDVASSSDPRGVPPLDHSVGDGPRVEPSDLGQMLPAETTHPSGAVAQSGRPSVSQSDTAGAAGRVGAAQPRDASVDVAEPVELVPGKSSGRSKPSARLRQFVAGPGHSPEKMLLVIEVCLTAEGAEKSRFEAVLREHGIAFDTNLAASSEVEQSLLESRFFEPRRGEGPREQAAAPTDSPVTLVYVVGRGDAIDTAWQQMRQDEVHFADVDLDMAVLPDDVAIFRRLRQLEELHIPAAAAATEEAKASVAHRIALTPGWNGIPEDRAETDSVQAAGTLRQLTVPHGPQPPSAPLWGGEITVEALFIVCVGEDTRSR